MNQKHIFWLILLFFTASIDLCMIRSLEQDHGIRLERSDLEDTEQAMETLRAFRLPVEDDLEIPIKKQKEAEPVLAYLFCASEQKKELEKWNKQEQVSEPEMYDIYLETVQKLLSDAVYFPVPQALNDEDATVSYEDSWQYARTYGGTRGHEGCDIMADVQRRGYYPVISTSDGVIEKIGWLPLGGYRVGIRSPQGVYYYYAHLAEYEEGITQGMEVSAGQLIGYMGDTGYSDVEGTTGNFPIHLHFGMYLNDPDGEEVSFNPYYLLRLIEKRKLKYEYTLS